MNSSNTPQPPEAIEQALRDFAHHMRFDATAVIAGERFEYNGMGYRLEHHGSLAADEVIVMVELGEYAPEDDRTVLRQLLRNQRRYPASRMGYYALADEGNMVFYCVPLNVGKAQACHDIAAVIQATSVGLATTLDQITRSIEQVAKDE